MEHEINLEMHTLSHPPAGTSFPTATATLPHQRTYPRFSISDPRRPGNQCGIETTKELLGIARLKIHPGKPEESNPAPSSALLPEQAPWKHTFRSARRFRPVTPRVTSRSAPQSLVTYSVTSSAETVGRGSGSNGFPSVSGRAPSENCPPQS